jgi:hypothetical protein
MKSWNWMGIGILTLCLGCSVTPAGIGDMDVAPETRSGTDAGDIAEIAFAETISADKLVTPGDVWAETSDASTEEIKPQCEAGEGCFMDGCTENSDCQSGWCVLHMGDKVCTQACQEECPPGWTCQQVMGTGPDVYFICVSSFSNLCRPCATGGDCGNIAGGVEPCLDYGDEGSFCGGTCGASGSECPWGFTCEEAATVDGIMLTQCVAEAGICPCTGTSAELGLWTPCHEENDWGLCQGKRVCGEDGLTGCDAQSPAEETCNGLDDNCDGQMDENTCDDDNMCTEDSCDGEAGCQFLPVESGECMDGNPCTVADHCQAGACVGDPVQCDDKNPCTDNVCAETGGCEYPANEAQCDDGNPCTVGDKCAETQCLGIAMPCDCQVDEDCDALEDENLCNGTLVCRVESVPYLCVVDPETVIECSKPEGADAPCLNAECDPLSGACSFLEANDGHPCEDGKLCTLGDSCVNGICGAGQAANCNDGNVCTDDSCDPDAGCTSVPNQAMCNDGSVCTLGDQCANGECTPGLDSNCNDQNPCTTDSCDPVLGCLHEAAEGQCNDGNECSTGDHCEQGTCVSTGLENCDDGNVCTDDSCSPTEGCMHTLNMAPCDDGSVCTTSDKCNLGACVGSGTLACDDGNVCTDDSCDAGVGCEHVYNQADCDDGNLCTGEDKCTAGWCLGATAIKCDDSNICTDDECLPKQGCVYTNNEGACNDGDLCTAGDICTQGICLAGQNVNCDDGLFCNGLESCNALSGCTTGLAPVLADAFDCTIDHCDEELDQIVHVPVHALCDDDKFCNGSEVCNVQLDCQPGAPPVQDDNDPCTVDGCDEDKDEVTHTPDPFVASPASISGLTTVESNQAGVVYTAAAVAGADSYSWTVPDGATVTDGQETSEITVAFGGASGQVCVTAINQCGESEATCVSITVASSEKRVFVTSSKFTGNLGGLVGADAKCQDLADGAGLSGIWKAWLSDATETAANRLTHSTKPYKMLNGQTVANNWADLTDDALSASWEINQNGNKIPFEPGGGVPGCSWGGGMFFFPWTGSANSGQPSGGHCNNWSTSGGTGRVGLGGYSLSQWTNWCDFPCSSQSRLYCLEQ